MAANTELTAAPKLLPRHATESGVGTTWQAFTLSGMLDARKVTVFASGACYVATEADGAADAGAVGSTRKALTLAQAAAGYEIAMPRGIGSRVTYICVAAQSGTVDVEVVEEG